MSNYVSLDEAAKILGVTTDELIEMRSRGEIFGYRDGTSWKFKKDEIDRVQIELGGDALDEEAGGSSVLVSERQVGPAGSKSGSTVGKGSALGSDVALDSDLKLAQDASGADSDVALVADPGSDSGVKLVSRGKAPTSEGSGISLDEPGAAGGSDGEVDLGSDLRLAPSPDESGVDLLKGSLDSNVLDSQIGSKVGSSKTGSKSGTGSGNVDLSELELAKDDEDDLVLGSDSGLSLGAESGINLMSPSDSGLSLDDEPLDLAGTGISGLDLGGEVNLAGSGTGKSGVGSGVGAALGSGALVDFQQGEEFQLTPSGSIETDDDSSSQVIELEDSSSFGDVGMPGPDLGAVQEAGGLDEGLGGEMVPGGGFRGIAEVPYTGLQVGMLTIILLLMGVGGILTTDILRNLWAWEGEADYSTGLTSMLVQAFGGS